jgi:hypothetical protein
MTKQAIVSEGGRNIMASYWTGKSKEKELNPTKAFQDYCRHEPWQLECREYDT